MPFDGMVSVVSRTKANLWICSAFYVQINNNLFIRLFDDAISVDLCDTRHTHTHTQSARV